MKTEDLKQLAEYMGYEATIGAINEKEVVFIWSSGDESLYSPLTSAEQCLELMEKFKISIQWLTGKNRNYWFSVSHEVKGKTINEAVANAAIEVIKE